MILIALVINPGGVRDFLLSSVGGEFV